MGVGVRPGKQGISPASTRQCTPTNPWEISGMQAHVKSVRTDRSEGIDRRRIRPADSGVGVIELGVRGG